LETENTQEVIMADEKTANTEQNTEQNEEQTAQNDKQFALQKIYVKDISFETPNSPSVFTEKWEPSVNIELNSNGKPLSQDVHEVVLGITITAKVGEKVAYLCEVHQAGIFTAKGFSEQELGPMLGSYCPNVLFPYAREAISDLVTKGGFPQLLLAPVNFDAIYMDHVKKQQAQAAENPSAEQSDPAKVH
jgi:preprotein translocase subunit SecB